MSSSVKYSLKSGRKAVQSVLFRLSQSLVLENSLNMRKRAQRLCAVNPSQISKSSVVLEPTK